MILNIGQVLASEKFVLEFDCEEDMSALEMADGTHPFKTVRAAGTVRNRYQGVDIECTVSADAAAPCARCLNEVHFHIETPLECFIGPKEGEDDLVRIENGRVINLHNAVKETLFDEYPSKLLCKEDCKGICPRCGKNLNDGDCGCQAQS